MGPWVLMGPWVRGSVGPYGSGCPPGVRGSFKKSKKLIRKYFRVSTYKYIQK